MDFTHTNHDFESELPKLIRDNIPAIHEKRTGQKALTRVAEGDEEYLEFLVKKMVEEAREVQASLGHGNLQEELADVLEIIRAIQILKGWSLEGIIKIQEEKRLKNGAFAKRLLLLKK